MPKHKKRGCVSDYLPKWLAIKDANPKSIDLECAKLLGDDFVKDRTTRDPPNNKDLDNPAKTCRAIVACFEAGICDLHAFDDLNVNAAREIVEPVYCELKSLAEASAEFADGKLRYMEKVIAKALSATRNGEKNIRKRTKVCIDNYYCANGGRMNEHLPSTRPLSRGVMRRKSWRRLEGGSICVLHPVCPAQSLFDDGASEGCV